MKTPSKHLAGGPAEVRLKPLMIATCKQIFVSTDNHLTSSVSLTPRGLVPQLCKASGKQQLGWGLCIAMGRARTGWSVTANLVRQEVIGTPPRADASEGKEWNQESYPLSRTLMLRTVDTQLCHWLAVWPWQGSLFLYLLNEVNKSSYL